MTHWGGLIELLVVLLFAAGWGVLEWVTRRMDRRRASTAGDDAAGDSRHSKG
jgi:hypothetical protein